MSPERRAGIIFTVAVIGILGLIGVILGTSHARGFEYTVVFKDAGGIRKGDRVQLAGADIGRVRKVELDRTGESVNVVLEIEKEHREKVRANSTAYIHDPEAPDVAGEKILEVVNSQTPSPPLPRRAVVMGKESAAEVAVWQFGDQVQNWSQQLRGMVEDLSEAARSGLEKGRENWEREQKRLKESRPTPEPPGNAMLPEGGTSSSPVPERESVMAPTESESDGTTSLRATRPGIEGARELLREFQDSEEYRDLVERMIVILQRLSEKGVPATIAQIVLDWQELKADLIPAIEVLREAGKLALADELTMLSNAVEEMIRLRQQELERRGNAPAPADQPAQSPDLINI